MKKLEQPIAQVSSYSVAYIELGAVASVKTGDQLNREGLTSSGDYPVINGGIAPSGYHDEFNTSGPVTVISQGGASAGYVNWMPGAIWAGAHCFTIKPNEHMIDSRYLYHFLKHSEPKIQSLKSGAGIPGLNRSKLIKLKCPVPPLEIQSEIVEILDTFTNLDAELEAELEARKLQYDFFTAKLFDESKLEGTCVLDDIVELKYGYTDIARDEGDLRFLRITDIDPNGKIRSNGAKFINSSAETVGYLVKSGDLLMARTGATYGKTALIDADESAVFASFLIRLRFDPAVMLPAFYWHFAQSQDFWRQANNLVSTGGQPQFNGNALKQLVIPLPSLETQKSVVKILDSLNALINDTKAGLPAEIAARRQQYEYFRGKLLTFKKLDSA